MRSRWMSLSFFVLAVIAFPTRALADTKVDLTEYVMPQPLAGDFKSFEFSTPPNRTLDVVSVLPWKKNGWQAVLTFEDEGVGEAAGTQFVVPGKKASIGELTAGGLAIDFDRPKRLFKLRTVPGKLNRFDMRGTAFLGGNPVGPGKYRGTWQFLGFEDVTTPKRTWSDAARLSIAASLRIKIVANGNIVEAFVQRTAWFAEGIGEVASEEAVSTFINGVPQDASARNGWLASGTWKGMPIP